MRILISGNTGFIGRHLVESLSKSVHYSMIYLTGMMDRTFDKCITLDIKGDVTNEEKVKKWLELAKPDTIVHLAAMSSPATERQNWQKMWSTNVDGTHNLLKYMQPKTRFILASSINVQNVTTLYAASKLAAEQLVKIYAPNGVSLRLCAVVGEYLTHGALKDLILKAKNQDRIQAWGRKPGSCKPYIHVNDVCEAIKDATISSCVGELNICNNDILSIDEMIDIIQEQLGTKKPVDWTGYSTFGDLNVISANNKLTYDVLGWQPTMNSRQAIENSI